VIKLSPATTIAQLSISIEEGSVYKMTTNGTSPYVYTTSLNKIINPGASDSPGKLTVSYNYKSEHSCTWEYFFGIPNPTGGISAKTNVIPASSEWKETIFDIGEYMTRFNWGTGTDHMFRIDPGDSREEPGLSNNRVVYMSNIQLNIY
jgi:hypothetical protein